MAWTDIFGGQTVNPQDLSYKSYSFAASVSLLWDNTTADASRVVADIMDVTTTVAGVVVSMPDARQAGAGEAALFFNAGAESFDVVSATGVAIITLAAGEAWYVWLRDNTTQSGLWRAIEFGAGTSAVAAASLASPTVKASGSALVQAMPVFNINSDYTTGANERGNLILWTGGVGTLTLGVAGGVGGDWFAGVRNAGSGTLTITRSGSDLIDGATSFTIDPAESATLVCDGTNYFAATKSLTPTNTFTLLSIDVAGSGDFTLSAGQLGFASYVFTGTLTGNRAIIVPNTVAPYRVRNNTSGSFTLTVKTAAGTGVAVQQNNGKFLVSDGTNVFDQVTPGIAIPLAISDGGTGATTASGARTNLGGTSVGNALFTAADAAAGRTTLDVPPNARQVATGTGLTGGGDLSADRTLSIAAGGVGTTQLADSGVTNAKLADMAEATFKGRAAAAGTGAPVDLTVSQAKTALAYSLGDLSDVDLSTPPATGDGLVFDGSNYAPGPAGGGMFKGDNGTVGSRSGDIFRINLKTLSEDVTIAGTENASATGPLAVATGKTLTVASGGTMVIL
jgi:hypothetical protein